jgi:ribosomal protein S18 acetylase RimI-like enzyme
LKPQASGKKGPPEMELRLRQLTPAHYATVKIIFRNAFHEGPYPDEALETSWIERSHPDSFGFFCKQGGEEKMIGFVIASYHSHNGSNLYIDYLALNPEFRGNGVGSALLRRLVEKCYRKGGSIHLYPEREELHDWYKRNGFYESSRNYYVFHSYSTRKQHAIHKNLGLYPN